MARGGGPDPSAGPEPRFPALPATDVHLRDFLAIFIAVMLPMLLAAIDQTLLATATPAIAAELGGLRDATWIAVGYLMATTITVPLYGRLGDRYGRARVLLVSLALFAFGSAVGGAAPSMGSLVVARVLQGGGGGGLMVMSQALIGELLPPRERPRFQGYFAATFALASIAGPVVGSLVVANASWRWLLFANLPLCAFAAWRVSKLPAGARPERGAPFADGRSAMLFATATLLTLLWLSFVGHRFAWLSTFSVAISLAAAALWWTLLRRERRLANPLLPIELLRVPGIATMAGTVTLFASCFFACVFFLPIYLRLGAGVATLHAGMLLLPLTLGMVIGSMTSGRIVARTGRPTPLPVIGLSLSACALVALSLIPPTALRVALLGLGCGIGFGTVMPAAQVTIQTLAGRAKLGAAAATVSLARSAGAVLGTALFGALVFSLVPGVNLDDVLLVSATDKAVVLHAFQIGFFAAAVIAVFGALVAARLPPLRL